MKWSIVDALATLLYITIVALVMNNAERIFGQMKSVIGPIAFLMLFVTSASITGALVLGRPILFYLDGKKTEAVKLFALTVAWMFGITIIALVVNIVL